MNNIQSSNIETFIPKKEKISGSSFRVLHFLHFGSLQESAQP